MTEDEIERVVEEVVRRLQRGGAPPRPTPSARVQGVVHPANPAALARFVAATPARIGVGRSGTRYTTEVALGIRADHAIAKDAVESELPPAVVDALDCLKLQSLCRDRQEYLLHPARGRRLDPASLSLLEKEGSKGADIQLIVGDGLSAWAVERNAPALVPLLRQELNQAGWSLGRNLFVRFARVGMQDHVGTVLGARASIILVGERPGLGTGDSLSIYIAYAPKLDQDNAEKNCISNVRAMGIQPPAAARQTVEILKRAFASGRGGVSR